MRNTCGREGGCTAPLDGDHIEEGILGARVAKVFGLVEKCRALPAIMPCGGRGGGSIVKSRTSNCSTAW
jgi:hypothetical protein